MKYLILIPDGMADRAIPELGGKTPMEAAYKPSMDSLCRRSECGTALNVPDGMVPESDTANLAILSYSPEKYSRGRSPLEAVSMGIDLHEGECAIRCNLVTLSDGDMAYGDRIMVDHSADEITTEEADLLVKALNEALPMAGRTLHTGVSYRHCLVWQGADPSYKFMRPHDIIGRGIREYLPDGEYLEFMKRGFEVLEHHPVNEARRARGLRPANSPWLWSPGTKPELPEFREKWGLRSAIISAVDLIRGIGICAGSDVIKVEGATGNFHTDYYGKAQAAIGAFRDGVDLVYIHVEAPDECGHRGETENKVKSIEKIDSMILAPVENYLANSGEDYRIMVLPDHPTPIEIRTHSSDPVPFFIFDSRADRAGVDKFTEANCTAWNNYVPDGSTLMERLVKGE